MLLHVVSLLLLLLAGGYFINAARLRCVKLKQQLTQQEALLLHQQQAVDAMLGELKDLVVRMDRQGRVLWANAGAKRTLPFPTLNPGATNSATNSVLSMMQMQRDPDWEPRLQQALQQLPKLSTFPTLHLNDHGSEKKQSFSLQLLPLGENQALLLCNDITQSLHQHQQRDELFTNLMHDLKTPLTSLLGYSDTLTTLGDNRAVREEAVAAIARGAKRINRLLDSLMTLASSEHMQQDKRLDCNVVTVARLVMDGIQDVAKTHEVTLELQTDGAINPVTMVANNCERMLFNVVENAVNHAPPGSVVTILLRNDGALLHIEVADHGCGVAKEYIPRLTERFYRLDTSRSKKGHGLGLAIVAEQIKQCGGVIKIRNNLPTGLLVAMKIPFSLPDDN